MKKLSPLLVGNSFKRTLYPHDPSDTHDPYDIFVDRFQKYDIRVNWPNSQYII